MKNYTPLRLPATTNFKGFIVSTFLFLALFPSFAGAQNYRASASAGTTAISLTITKPANTMSGDVMIAAISIRSSTVTITPPTGWALIRRTDNATGSPNAQAMYWKAAGGSEPANYTWSFSSSIASSGGILTFYNVSSVAPTLSTGVATASALTHAATGVTTTSANNVIISAHSFASAATWSPPAGMTEAVDAASITAPNTTGESIQMNYVVQAAAGATGTKTATASANANTGVAQLVALVPLGCTTPAAPGVTTPVNYCLNATATPLSASGSNLTWGTGGTTSGSVGGTAFLTTVAFIDGQYGPSTAYTAFTTFDPNVTITSIDYTIPAYQSVTGLVISIYNSSNTLIATSTAQTQNNNTASPVKVTKTFNYTIAAAGNYTIKASAGYGNIGGDNPTYPITEPTGTINLTGNLGGGYRNFNNVQFTVGSGGTAPTPATTATGTTNYIVSQTVNGCRSPHATIAVVVSAPSTTAAAGPDQTGSATCGSTTVALAGNAPTSGTGAWTIVSGTGGTIATPTSRTSNFTGTAGSTYTLRWTISNGCSSSADDVVITFNRNPTTSNAGPDQTGAATCGLTSVTLAGNAPTVGVGAWSIVNGTGGNIATPASRTSTFTGVAGNTYTLRWTVSNSPCTASVDDVVITFNRNPTTAAAGPDQTGSATCGLTTVTLAANTPAVGTGAWTILSGAGGTVNAATSPTSTFTGTAGTNYTLRWTISNGSCTASADDVAINLNTNPTPANAGTDQTACGLTSVTLAGNTPVDGTGTWTVVSGTGGTFSSASNPISTFSGTAGATYTLRWTITNSPCTASTDDVVIIFGSNPVASGTSTQSCIGGSTGQITASGTGGTLPYTYSLNAGPYQSSNLFTGLNAGSYTVNVQSAAGCIASTTVVVSDFANAPDDQNTAGTNTWNGHMYDGTAFNNYKGQFTEAETFDESFGGDAACFNLASSAGSRSILTESLSAKLMMNSTRSGLYIVDLGSDDGSRLTVDGALVYNNWSDQGFSTKARALLNLNGTSQLLYEFYENSGGNRLLFQNLTLVLANTLSANLSQNLCTGSPGVTISGDIYGALPAGISLSGTGYQWSYSLTPGGARTNITGETSGTFTPSTAVAPFNTAGTYYVYRNAVLSSANNVSPNPYVATHESNAAIIIVSTAPSATISYVGNPFCSSAGTAAVNQTGTTGGSYTASPAGLSINASTGEVNLAASTAGTYTITYTIAASAGCSVYTTTTSITVSAPPSATISYSASPYCTNAGTATVTRTGTAGGTYSSTAGLTIDGATGNITLASSTAGTYTVTYTMVNGGCTTTTTTSVTISAAPTASISYTGTPYCTSSGTATITQTGTAGGTYSSTGGLSLNASTGAVNLGASTAGTYTVTYTIAASNGCSVYTTTTSITITTQPWVTGTYPGNPYCTNFGLAYPVGSKAGADGVLTSTTGLTINSSNGVVNLGTSTPGTYTITYAVPASGGCNHYSLDYTLVIIASPSATISYPAPSFCANAGLIAVTRTGTAGGVYSSAAGLSINASTGEINANASTPGNYTVTYRIAASGSCAAFTTTRAVAITAVPNATISYAASPYCTNGGSATVTRTGTAGGSYTSTAGLTINSTTGEITLSTSTAGTYTITYTVAAAGGCSVFTTTTSVIVSAPSSATISYSASPYCSNAGTATVTRTGTAGGTYSSTAGLTINAATGDITLASSTAGTYTVTYTMVNGGCTTTSTTSVTVTTAPAATISYSGSPFCSNSGTGLVTRTGTTGGVYSSTAGLQVNSSTGAVDLAASTPGDYTVTYTVSAAGGCAQYQATASISILTAGVWTGAISTDWNTSGNWLCGGVPVTTTDVLIPADLTRYPSITAGTSAVHNLTIESAGTLLVSAGTLKISGTITNNGTFTATTGSIEMNGTTAQLVPTNVFAGNLVKDLSVNNTAGVTLGDTLKLTGALTISNGSLNTVNKLVLKSSATQTARVAHITSNSVNPIIGNVTVERYIPGRRKFRLITSSVTTSVNATLNVGQEALSIWGNWQNSGINTVANRGTFITGGSAAAGFDQHTINASLYTYNDTTRRLIAFSSANGKNTKYTPLKAGVPYFMFVYGDRKNSVSTSSPNSTVLQATGTLLTGDQVYDHNSLIPLTNVPGRYTFLGNPFASPVDWTAMPKNDLANTYWGYDPNLSSTGGYVTVSTFGTQTIVSPRSGTIGINQYIQSGQGFFVRTIGTSPSLTVREQDKVANFNNLAFREPGSGLPLIAINLLYKSGQNEVLADGTIAAFDPAFSNQVRNEDAVKMVNWTEVIGIENGGELLSTDARNMPVDSDTLFLNVSKLTRSQYTLQIFTEEMQLSNVVPYLQDSYLKTSVPLSLTDTSRIEFSVLSSDAASSDVNRFRIVFKSSGLLPVNFTSVTAVKKENDVQVDWSVVMQDGINKYELEHSVNGLVFNKKVELKAQASTGAAAYKWLDVSPSPGVNYYRVRAIRNNGTSLFSKVVTARMNTIQAFINVLPNPVRGSQMILQLNNVERGQYTLLIVNSQGQQLLKQTIEHTGGSAGKIIQLHQKVPPGVYFVTIENDKTKYLHEAFFE